ncbi:NEDD4-binding protein 2 isoform X2 [Salminus brasiliensis]|uniref:NEDD4-binding protein 2 isoform X2 n=1 Tax=Salminus brasiliensis TaxID=930266 RepID=UPI003B82E8C6
MPKKKKNGHSPGRVSAQAGESEARGHGGNAAASRQAAPPNYRSNSRSTLPTSCESSFQRKDEIVRSMQEMFSHLDPVVIYIVLSEADFKVENAMDALLELSDAAEGKISTTPPCSGFEMAAALLDSQPCTNKTESDKMILECFTVSDSVEPRWDHSPEATHLTEEFDSVIDQELETLASLQSHPGNQSTLSSVPLSSLPSLSTDPGHQAISKLEQLDVESDPKLAPLSSNSTPRPRDESCRVGSPVSELSFGGASCLMEKDVSVDFSHLTEDSNSRPSAFKAYCRPNTFTTHANLTAHPECLNTPAMFWNIQAPEFQPRVGGPVFTPKIKAPIPWNDHPFTTAQWLPGRPVSQAPLKPSATVPKSWTLPSRKLILEGPVLVLLRGAPGSGKTTLASAMLEQNPGGLVLSTDEYFTQNGTYHYKPDLLGEAHAWNHMRAKDAFESGHSPIIVDNTNMQCWEMKPYVALALKHKYRVLFREPDTWWKTKPRELEKRTKHGVTKEKIRRMLENQDRYVSVQNIMASQPKSTAVFGVDIDGPKSDTTQQPLPAEPSRPDLVGDSAFGIHLSSSLPDVSSVCQKFSHNSAGTGAAEAEVGLHSSKESVSSQGNTEKQIGTTESELLDGASLDWELESCITFSGCTGLNVNKEHLCNPDMLQEKAMELPVAFSESIGQRVKREKERSRFAGVVDANQFLNFKLDCDTVTKATQEDGAEQDDTAKQKLLNFVGDWPSESLEQRGQRSRRSDTQTLKHLDEKTPSHVEDSCIPDNIEHSDYYSRSKTEFQNVLDLLQGEGLVQESARRSASSPGDEQKSSLGTEVQKILPDCVHEWKFGRSTDPGKGNSQPQSPSKEIKINENEYERGPTEPDGEIQTTTNDRIDVQTVDLEVMDKSSFTPETTLSLRDEADHNAEVSKEKRKGSSRRAGKSCRLALTFTNQSPSSACLHTGSPATSPQLLDLMPPPQLELLLPTCLCASVQTDPQEFALLWRINQKFCELDSSAPGIVILEGNPLRFVPNTGEKTASGQQEVPYRVCHEKGSQVEESDLIELPLKQHSLKILSHHFKHVPMETLEDLYEKCHQDMDWTTNLLLDSGEELYREEEDAEDNLDPLVTEEEDLEKEEFCARQVTGHSLVTNSESKEDAMRQASIECPGAHFVVPGTSGDYSLTVSADARESEDNVKLEKSELIQTSNDDQNSFLQFTHEEADHNDTGAEIECTFISSNSAHPDQPFGKSRAQQDPSVSNSTESETEIQQVPGQELTLVSQREIFEQYFDGGLEGWIEEEVRHNMEEDEVTKEEVDAITRSFFAQLEDMENKKEEEKKERGKERSSQGKKEPLDIQILELKLPTELALQLTELFGPVGISPGEFSPEDCSVLMDLNLAKLLHQKWKETIQERHRQAALSYHLLQQSSVHWGETLATDGQRDSDVRFLIGADGYSSLMSQSNIQDGFPLMDHWNVSRPPVSLRNIMIEEQVMQESLEKSRLSRWDLDKKDGAAILKEKQLFTLFPTIDRHFLRDIFRDHNYSLEQTEQFLRTLLDDGPVRNVVAAEVASEHFETHRAPSKERKRKQKNEEPDVAQFQDTEDPEYEDFRTEAMLQRRQQQECFDKAAEAHRQGQKDVASFYAQQFHLLRD